MYTRYLRCRDMTVHCILVHCIYCLHLMQHCIYTVLYSYNTFWCTCYVMYAFNNTAKFASVNSKSRFQKNYFLFAFTLAKFNLVYKFTFHIYLQSEIYQHFQQLAKGSRMANKYCIDRALCGKFYKRHYLLNIKFICGWQHCEASNNCYKKQYSNL